MNDMNINVVADFIELLASNLIAGHKNIIPDNKRIIAAKVPAKLNITGSKLTGINRIL